MLFVVVEHGRFQLFSIAVPAIPIPAHFAVPAVLIPAIPAVPAVPIPAVLAIPAVPVPKTTAVLCGSDAILIPVWNCIEPQFGFMRFYAVFAVPAIQARESPTLS